MKFKIFFLLLVATTLLNGQNAELVLDLNPGPMDGITENTSVLGTVGNAIVLENEDYILYSDGTAQGTRNIYDLSNSEIVFGEGHIDGELYLSEYTSTDTSRIIKISSAGEVEILLEESGYIQIYLEYKDKLYYDKKSNFTEYLYSFDPITKSAEEVIESRWFMRSGLKEMVVFNNLIYMIVWPEDMSESFLATYDGEGNLEFIHEFYSANVDLASRFSVNMTVADSNLFFWFGDGTNEAPLYVTDGTSGGTQILNTEFERYSRSQISRSIGVFENKVLFEGIDSDNERHLWSSDGTIAGTFKIEVPAGIEMKPKYFTPYKGKLLFSAYYGSQPFSAPSISTLQTDGTKEGTEVILNPDDIPDSSISNGYWLTSHNDSLFMVGRNTRWPYNNDLYKSDGTPEGTVKVSMIGDESGNEISLIVSAGQNLFFLGTTDSLGRELYVYKSTLADQDNDGFTADVDCDDNNPDINPAQTEEPYNGTDDDCDASTLDDDLDQDGYLLADDCDDSNSNINPAQTEEPYNGIDDDCDSTTLDDDLDQDGFLIANDCDDDNPTINPNADEIPNNGIDEDCDGTDLMTSIHELANTTINIFPNPTVDRINIDVDGNLEYKASLYNLQGKLLMTASNTRELQVISYPTGTYLLEIKDIESGQKIVERIIIGR